MATRFCPECGAEYVAGVDDCADCRVPLVSAGGGEEEVAYDLGDWDAQPRLYLGQTLGSEGIRFYWEGGDLVVHEADSERVEQVIEEMESFEPLDEDAVPPGEDEVPYSVVSDLFVAADRLAHAPDDVVVAGDFVTAAEVVMATAPPYGVAHDDWARIRGIAASLHKALEEDVDPDVVAGDARQLRELLHRYV